MHRHARAHTLTHSLTQTATIKRQMKKKNGKRATELIVCDNRLLGPLIVCVSVSVTDFYLCHYPFSKSTVCFRTSVKVCVDEWESMQAMKELLSMFLFLHLPQESISVECCLYSSA